MLRELQHAWGFTYADRVHAGEVKLCTTGLWDVPHPSVTRFVHVSLNPKHIVGVRL
jgi:hypothetical protein